MTTTPSRHKCLIYDGDPSEHFPVIVPLLIDGLREGRRCLYLGERGTIDRLDEALLDKGVDTRRETERGALVYSDDRGHLQDGVFDPKAMIAGLSRTVGQAVSDGFSGLFATGDMRWELGEDRNFERLREYEALLEAAFRELPLMGVCQYHRKTVPVQALQDALMTHRSLYLGGELNEDNLFYVPPELLLASGGAPPREALGDWMHRQLLRTMRAERERDEVLRDLERKVQERTENLARINKELEAFSYSVSHDLRAPVRRISGFSDILGQEGERLSPEGRGALGGIGRAAKLAAELIDDLLAFSRLEQAELRKGKVDLDALLARVRQDLEPELKGRGVSWRVAALPELHGDPALMRQVFANLLANAVKFTRSRPEAVIEVGGERRGGEHVVFVRDNGVGFDPSQAHKLFGVFQRLHAQEEFEGTGIGLANVRRIVHRHGGRVWAESEPGKGATFYVALPLRGGAG